MTRSTVQQVFVVERETALLRKGQQGNLQAGTRCFDHQGSTIIKNNKELIVDA